MRDFVESGCVFGAVVFGEVEGQQILDIGVMGTLGQLREDMPQPGEWLDATGAAGQHQAIDNSAGPCSRHGVTEEP